LTTREPGLWTSDYSNEKYLIMFNVYTTLIAFKLMYFIRIVKQACSRSNTFLEPTGTKQ